MSTRYPGAYLGMYSGGLSAEQCANILAVKQAKSIPNLKNLIYKFTPELVIESIDKQKSIRSLLAERGETTEPYKAQLRDYQTTGVAFMYMSNKSIIADGCGLGKTVEVAGLINLLHLRGESRRFIILVENSAYYQTVCELIKYTGLNIVGLPSEAAKFAKTIKKIKWSEVDGMVIKHSMLNSDTLFNWIACNTTEKDGVRKCGIFDTIYLDESSVIKNSGTKKYDYTVEMCKLARRVHYMNATTFETSIVDIYNQYDAMDQSLMPPKSRVDKQFCSFGFKQYWVTERQADGSYNRVQKKAFDSKHPTYKNQAEFKNQLGLVYFGRSKKDVGLDIPNEYKVELIKTTQTQDVAIGKYGKYNEILNCPILVSELKGKIKMSRKDVPKLDRVCSLLEGDYSDSNVMIYCFHIEAQKALKSELEAIGKTVEVINGKTKDFDRFSIQERFNNKEIDVVITNIKKSLNLYGADVCIVYSSETNPAKMEQITKRIDRNVDEQSRTFILMLYDDSPELDYFLNVVSKRAKDARDLILDAESAVDFFFNSLQE